MNHLRTLAILACVAAACAGCDRAWEAYQQIELGQPIPADNLLMTDGWAVEGQVRAWGDAGYVPFPAIGSGLGVRAVVDAEGDVTAKSYIAQAFGHWLICQSVALRTAMEVNVPEEIFHDPPAGGLSYRWRMNFDTMVSPAGRVQLTPAARDDEYALEPAEDPTNVLAYLILVREHCSGHSYDDPAEPVPDEPPFVQRMLSGVFFSLGMFTGGRMDEFSQLAQYAPQLVRITEEGFNWTYRNSYGYELRIRNLGGRRFRVEEKFFRVFDPFMLIPTLEIMGQEDPDPRIHSTEFSISVDSLRQHGDDAESDGIPDDMSFPPGPPELPDGEGYDVYDDYDPYYDDEAP